MACIGLISGYLKGQVSTFSASVLKADTVFSSQKISTGVLVTNDTLVAHDKVIAKKSVHVKGNLFLKSALDFGHNITMRSYPASGANPPFLFFGTNVLNSSASKVFPGGSSWATSCFSPMLGANYATFFGGSVGATAFVASDYNNFATGSAVFGYDGTNGVIDVQGTSTLGIPGSLFVNYYCHRNVAICTGSSSNPTENQVFIGRFLSCQKHVEIGDTTYGTGSDLSNAALMITANAGKGLLFKTWNSGLPVISIRYGGGIPAPTTSPFTVLGDGRTRIGTLNQSTSPNHYNAMLSVYGKMVATSCYVTQQNWADDVFNADYKIPTPYEIEKFYKENHHLSEIPTEKEVIENGIDVGEMNRLLLKKVEELTILMVKQQKEIDELKKHIKNAKTFCYIIHLYICKLKRPI